MIIGSNNIDDFITVENSISILQKKLGINIYEFDFRTYFEVKSLYNFEELDVIARIGAINNYKNLYDELLRYDVKLIHTTEEHDRCSLLPIWHPLIYKYTPESYVFEKFPEFEDLSQVLELPVFVKGERQTSKHKKSTSIINNRSEFEKIKGFWYNDNILRWQKVVFRKFIKLKIINDTYYDRVPDCYEFRLFYYKKNLVGLGPYWYNAKPYFIKDTEKRDLLKITHKVAKKINVDFLVVDAALTENNEWIIIEVNDGQESGYAGIEKYPMWKRIVEIEKNIRQI